MSAFITVFFHMGPPAHTSTQTNTQKQAIEFCQRRCFLLLFLDPWANVCLLSLQRAFLSAGYLLRTCLLDIAELFG